MNNKIKNIKTILLNEPLIINWENIDMLKNPKRGSIFFGVGLMSKTQIAEEIPFDILSFFFTSELIRKALEMKKVIALIADEHARTNRITTPERIDNLATKTEKSLTKIIRNFALDKFEILKASELHTKESFSEMLNHIPPMENEYLRLEVADTKWLEKNENLMIKIGWAITKEKRVAGHDERFFDQEILKLSPKVTLIHIKAGRTLDRNRPKASPYLSVKGEKRIVLKKGENVGEKLENARIELGDKKRDGHISHLHDIVHVFEKVQGKLPFLTIEEKVQFLINKAVA